MTSGIVHVADVAEQFLRVDLHKRQDRIDSILKSYPEISLSTQYTMQYRSDLNIMK